MIPSLRISATGLDAQQTNMSVISNNLANVSTTGFKRDRAVFEDLIYQNVRQAGAQSTQDTELPSGSGDWYRRQDRGNQQVAQPGITVKNR